jgi:hypothetical protein
MLLTLWRKAVESTALATEFVAFCLERRPACWPEIYDEMCWVASQRLFRGLGYTELSQEGVFFSLTHLPRLRRLVEQVSQTMYS